MTPKSLVSQEPLPSHVPLLAEGRQLLASEGKQEAGLYSQGQGNKKSGLNDRQLWKSKTSIMATPSSTPRRTLACFTRKQCMGTTFICLLHSYPIFPPSCSGCCTWTFSPHVILSHSCNNPEAEAECDWLGSPRDRHSQGRIRTQVS